MVLRCFELALGPGNQCLQDHGAGGQRASSLLLRLRGSGGWSKGFQNDAKNKQQTFFTQGCSCSGTTAKDLIDERTHGKHDHRKTFYSSLASHSMLLDVATGTGTGAFSCEEA